MNAIRTAQKTHSVSITKPINWSCHLIGRSLSCLSSRKARFRYHVSRCEVFFLWTKWCRDIFLSKQLDFSYKCLSANTPYSLSSACLSYQKDKWNKPENLQKATLSRKLESTGQKSTSTFYLILRN